MDGKKQQQHKQKEHMTTCHMLAQNYQRVAGINLLSYSFMDVCVPLLLVVVYIRRKPTFILQGHQLFFPQWAWKVL